MSDSLTPARRRARLLRWGVPAGVLAVALVVPASGRILSANAAPSLPPRTPAQLLVDLQTARVDGMSGTVVQHSDLGLPQLPGAGGSGSSSLTSLISGTHTMRIWYSGPDKARLALLGTLGESDVVLNKRDLWIWSSDQKTAQHRQLPAQTKAAPDKAAKHPELPTTPQSAADQALAAITPTTKVSTAENATVAGRPAYELVIAPKDTRSLVHEVRVAIDSATHVPLRLQAFAAGRQAPAFEVGFTQVSFQRPGDEQFRFTPPPGTKVTEATTEATTETPTKTAHTEAGKSEKPARSSAPTVVGTGWTSVIVAKAPTAMPSAAEAPQGAPDVNRILANLPRVRGTWGSGRLLRSSLFSVLLTDDGRVVAGAVAPELLYAAAAK